MGWGGLAAEIDTVSDRANTEAGWEDFSTLLFFKKLQQMDVLFTLGAFELRRLRFIFEEQFRMEAESELAAHMNSKR